MSKLLIAAGASLTLLISAAIAGEAANKGLGIDAGVTNLVRSPLASQNRSGFGGAIAFLPAAHTPPGITNPVRSALASQDRSGFGEAIAFLPAAYTPPGITNPVGPALASQNYSGFGQAIEFTPSGYTPPGIWRFEVIGAVAAE